MRIPAIHFTQLLMLLKSLASVLASAIFLLPDSAQSAVPVFVTREVIPSATDPQITTTNYNQPHIVVLATNVPPLGKLLLHLPGTSSHPEGAQDWLRTAATHGYHAIGLKYQNDVSMGSLCTLNTNLDCFEEVADETVTGLFYPDAMPDAPKQVRRADSIENRVQKLLAGLAALAPASENWGQFLNATGGVRWSQVAVSGHSQGGSCALFIAKSRSVDRAVLFATMDWIRFPTNRQPAWFANPGVTPAERIYGFTHHEDNLDTNGFWQQEPIWADIGLATFGPVTFIESSTPPYTGSHQLTSNVRPGATNDDGSLKYHVSVIADEALPRLPNGLTAWLPVWSYLLTNVAVAPAQIPLVLSTNATGGQQVTWPGNAAYSSQLEHSRDFVAWARLDLPTPEVNDIMSLEIPPYLLDDDERFFRLIRTPLVTSPIPTTPGYYTNQTFVHGGIARRYFLKIPAAWNPSTHWPLVLLLPGHGQSIAEFASTQQEILRIADTNGWIIAFVEATAGTKSYKWFSSENPNLTQPYFDDAAFLIDLVDAFKASALNVNNSRVYLGGFSNGGSMAHYMASRTNHPFAAFAIIESGTDPLAEFKEPYNRLDPESGTNVLASVPLPWQPRPVLIMNMVTSIPWAHEGRGPIRGSRHNVARWTGANGYGGVVTNSLRGILEPPPARTTNITTWTATGNNRSKVAYEDIRPDHNWPTNLVLNGWSLTNALRFPYLAVSGTNVINQRLPEWIRTAYPHTLSPDPTRPDAFVRVDAGTMSVEIWRSGPVNRTNEVIFVTLGDGGHQWPNSGDQLPFNANVEVLKFFDAH